MDELWEPEEQSPEELRREAKRISELKRAYPLTETEVIEFLNSNKFKQEIAQAMGKAKRMEQGMIVGYSKDGKFIVVHDREVGENFSVPNWDEVEKKRLLPVGWIQFHPLSDVTGQFYDHIPSDSDLAHTNIESAHWVNGEERRQVHMFGGLIVPGRKPLGWVWGSTTLTESQIDQIYNEWEEYRSGTGYDPEKDWLKARAITYKDIEELTQDLKNSGMHIENRELDGNNVAGSFASLLADMHLKFGFV